MLALAAGATLALGIGATTAVYTVVDRVLMAPLPYPGSEGFVRVQGTFKPWSSRFGLTPALLTEWKTRTRAFDLLEAYDERPANLVGGGGPPAVVREARVTAGLLPELLDLEPVIGRLFDPAEQTITNAGLLELEDAESGACTVIDTSSPELRAAFERTGLNAAERSLSILTSARADTVAFSTQTPVFDTLSAFFRKRQMRRNHL